VDLITQPRKKFMLAKILELAQAAGIAHLRADSIAGRKAPHYDQDV
jgi:hypothetical protein